MGIQDHHLLARRIAPVVEEMPRLPVSKNCEQQPSVEAVINYSETHAGDKKE